MSPEEELDRGTLWWPNGVERQNDASSDRRASYRVRIPHVCRKLCPDRYDQNYLVSKCINCFTDSIFIHFIIAYSYQPDSSECCTAVLHSSGNFLDVIQLDVGE